MTHRRELSVGIAIGAILLVLALSAPTFFAPANIRDMLLANAPILIAAIGTTLVILTGEIDISIGSQMAVLSIAAGALAKTGAPAWSVALAAAAFGCALGAINGVFVAFWRVPSIVVTLATMMIWREALRWTTGGAWVENLPNSFQWFGLSQTAGQTAIIVIAAALFVAFALALRHVAAGRAVYATGCSRESAHLAGIPVPLVVLTVFVIAGALVGIASVLSVIRFHDVPANTGIGLELRCITAAVVGGAAITGGRGTLLGTLLGVALLGIAATALIFLGISPYWERALEGAIILAAVALDRPNLLARATAS